MKSRNSDSEEIKKLRVCAQKGDVAAQFQLGWKYANGRGVVQSDKEAAYWYDQVLAKDPTNPVALFNLGWMYANGRGVVPDPEKAIGFYSRAADQGNVSAQLHLGFMYLNGEGGAQDESVALEWFRKAAAQGDESAKALVKRMEKNLAEEKQTIFGVFAEKTKEKEEAKKLTKQRKAILCSMDWRQKNSEGDNVFHTAAIYKKRPQTFKNLLEMSPANERSILLKETNSEGNTPLHLLASQGQVDLIQDTIAILGEEARSILSVYNHRGYLPIHEAVESGAFEAIRVLIKAGADANALTQNGLTVAQCAAQKGYPLLEKELNKSATTVFSSPKVNSPQISLSHSASSFPRKLDEDCIDEQGRATINLVIPHGKLLKMGPLGGGSFATVYRGRYQRIDVAIKKLFDRPLLQDTLRNEMRREAGIMLQLPHPNIVKLYGIVFEPECCIVLEYMQNGSLYMLLHSEKTLSWKEGYEIVVDIAKGLTFLHENGIIHRDLKSLNVLLDKANQAKISDFGLSRITFFSDNDNEQPALEGAAPIKGNKIGKAGTVPWIAPELFRQGQDYTLACDVYSFGMIIWEIMTRSEPYAHIAALELVERWVQEGNREKIPEEAPPILRELTVNCWAGDPTMRPTMEVVLEKLEINPVEDNTAIPLPYSLPPCEEENSCFKSEEGSLLNIALAEGQAFSYKGSEDDEYVRPSSESALTIASSPKSNEILPDLGREVMKKSTAPGTPGFFTPMTMGGGCGLKRNPAAYIAEAPSKSSEIADTRKNEVREKLTLGESEFFSKPVERGYGLSQSQDIIRKKQKYPQIIASNYMISSFSSQEYDIKEQAIASKSYFAIKRGSLSFQKGTKLTILDKTDPKWWQCELNGKKGLVPSSHINIIKPDVQSGTSRYIMGSGYN